MIDDLSTRLLSAISKTEGAAHLTDADLIPRLCQAHREMVEMYRAAAEQDLTDATENAYEHARRVALEDVVDALAGAYGLEEGE